jgi:hypothetical protein
MLCALDFIYELFKRRLSESKKCSWLVALPDAIETFIFLAVSG